MHGQKNRRSRKASLASPSPAVHQPTPVRQRLQFSVVVLAWFLATGCQWDVVQVVAWGRMFSSYSTGMSLSAAARKTFSGEACELCQVARDGRAQQEADGDATLPATPKGKLPDLCLLTLATPVIIPAPGPTGLLTAAVLPEGRGRASPPLPPPRA